MIAVSTFDVVGGLVMVLFAAWCIVFLELDDRRKRAADDARQQIPTAANRDSLDPARIVARIDLGGDR